MKKYTIQDGIITAENYSDTKAFPVIMKKWTNTEGTMTRYYVKRAGEQIGWISGDKTTGKGQGSSTNQTYIDRMVKALNGDNPEI